ncbi:MAG: hypothetical protein A3H91_01890 [Gammaproteobacteria bacterium RIFCSPLOWO2_02_FULL_61_13]|nr:MAG: hypothetical protein A3H91_01890 [Gammaproteobacteria bacterium RIFCSPLOWO2_02_FULL_61_13]
MKPFIKFAVLAVFVALQGCSAPVREADAWPAQLPARQYFVQNYESDAKNAAVQTQDQYLAWVRRFYEGSEIYAWGFLDLESLVLDGLDGESARSLKAKLDTVGLHIGGEWAKDRNTTRITTRMLSLWAEAIQIAQAAGPVESVVDQVLADVGAVLAGEMKLAEITPDRYGTTLSIAFMDGCVESSGESKGSC